MLRSYPYYGEERKPTKKERREQERRRSLPYGIWICDDGREVLFNRHYKPIWQRKDGEVTPADPKEWVKWKKQSWFFKDDTAPDWRSLRPDKAMRRCMDVLTEFHGNEPITKYIVSGDQ